MEVEANGPVELPVEERASSSKDVFDMKNLEQCLPSVQHQPGKISLHPKTLDEMRFLKIRKLMQLRKQRLSEGEKLMQLRQQMLSEEKKFRCAHDYLDWYAAPVHSIGEEKFKSWAIEAETRAKFIGGVPVEKDRNNVCGTSEPTLNPMETKVRIRTLVQEAYEAQQKLLCRLPRGKANDAIDSPIQETFETQEKLFCHFPGGKASSIRETVSFLVRRQLSREKRALFQRGLSPENSDEQGVNLLDQVEKHRLYALKAFLDDRKSLMKDALDIAKRIRDAKKAWMQKSPQMNSVASNTDCRTTEISTQALQTTPFVAADNNQKSVNEIAMQTSPFNH